MYKTEREREGQTDRQTDIDRDRDSDSDRQTDRDTHRDRQTESDFISVLRYSRRAVKSTLSMIFLTYAITIKC